uniref:Uncharacterized protein n=1 Tax=Solanum tuberosum TaxID=4113 RepID=M0ZUL1_SOLTU
MGPIAYIIRMRHKWPQVGEYDAGLLPESTTIARIWLVNVYDFTFPLTYQYVFIRTDVPLPGDTAFCFVRVDDVDISRIQAFAHTTEDLSKRIHDTRRDREQSKRARTMGSYKEPHGYFRPPFHRYPPRLAGSVSP